MINEMENTFLNNEWVKLPTELRDFMDTTEWTVAKTMPEWPHEYLVRNCVDEGLFEKQCRIPILTYFKLV